MSYQGSIDLISGIRAKNNGAFPLVNAKDVYLEGVSEGARLDAVPVYGTTAEWAANRAYVPVSGQLIIYTDRTVGTDSQGNPVQGIGFKLGDGSSYVADLPFAGEGLSAVLDASLSTHIANATMHLTAAERTSWNRKITTGNSANSFQEVVGDTLILSKD